MTSNTKSEMGEPRTDPIKESPMIHVALDTYFLDFLPSQTTSLAPAAREMGQNYGFLLSKSSKRILPPEKSFPMVISRVSLSEQLKPSHPSATRFSRGCNQYNRPSFSFAPKHLHISSRADQLFSQNFLDFFFY